MVVFEITETTISTKPEKTFKDGQPASFTATLKGNKVSDVMLRIEYQRGHLGLPNLKTKWKVEDGLFLSNSRDQHFYPNDEEGWVETYTYHLVVTWRENLPRPCDLKRIASLLNEQTGKPALRWG